MARDLPFCGFYGEELVRVPFIVLILAASAPAVAECPNETAEPALEAVSAVADEADLAFRCELWDVNKFVLQRMNPVAAMRVALVLCDKQKYGARTLVQLYGASEFAVRYRVLRGDRNLIHFLGEAQNGVRANRYVLAVPPTDAELSEPYATNLETFITVKDSRVTAAHETELSKMNPAAAAVLRGVIHSATTTQVALSNASVYSVEVEITEGKPDDLQRVANVLGVRFEDGKLSIPMADSGS